MTLVLSIFVPTLALAFSTVCVYLKYVCVRFDQILLHHLHVHSRDYGDIRWAREGERKVPLLPPPSRAVSRSNSIPLNSLSNACVNACHAG